MKQLEWAPPRRRVPPSATGLAGGPVSRESSADAHPSRFCGCLRMSHVKNSFLLLSCVFIAAASLCQTSDAAKGKQPVATVDGQTIYDDDLVASVQGQLLPLRNQEYEIKK